MPNYRSDGSTFDLAPPDPDWKGTGAIYRPDDVRDYHLEFLPQVAAALEVGLPPSFSVVEPGVMPFIYDQGPEGSCCPNSICGAKTIEDFADIGKWNHYDAHQIYAELGGTGPNGIAADPALRYVRDLGCRNIADSRRFKIGSYMFAPRNRGEWRQTLSAALVATGPCVVAMLLPSTFGWDSSGQMTSGYHQMCFTGYEGLADNDYAVFLNSWDITFGNRGFCRVRWGFLEGNNFQDKHVYGAKMVDVRDYVAPDPEPKPDPDPNGQPHIRKVKGTSQKVKVLGEWNSEAVLFVSGERVSAGADEGRFTYKPVAPLELGTAINFTVRNPGGLFDTKIFTPEE